MYQNAKDLRAIALILCAGLTLAGSAAAAQRGSYLNVQVDMKGNVLYSRPGLNVSTPVYLNELENDLTSRPQNGEEWADDIHTSANGELTGFGAAFSGFVGVDGDSFDVTFTLYENSGLETMNGAGSSSPGAVILGPWTIRLNYNVIGLGIGFDPFGLSVGPDLWLGVSFSDPNVGLVLHDPPTIGSSGDRFWNVTQGMEQNFGGNPAANFVMSVNADMPLPVVTTTWSGIKSLY